MLLEDKKRILKDLRIRWQMTKTACNECIADELIEFGNEIEKDLEVLDIVKNKTNLFYSQRKQIVKEFNKFSYLAIMF